MTNFLSLSFSLLCSLGVGAPTLEVGAQAPQFEASDCDGNTQNLQELIRKGPVVLVFFPKANSQYCTQELQTFVSRASEIKSYGATVVALSSDKPEVLKAFRDDLKANFAFVTDAKALIAARYGARMPVIPQARRRTFVVDQTQHIIFVERDEDAMNLKGVVQALEALHAK